MYYTNHKLCRRVGRKLCDSAKCPVLKKPYPPGVSGKKKRRALSEYGAQLQEKQKIRYVYNISEKQLKSYFTNARSLEEFFYKIEMRLDNVAYLLGFVTSRNAARQSASHGHYTVNGKTVNVPSFRVRVGDVISIKPSKRGKGLFRDTATLLKKHTPPVWLSLDADKMEGKVVALPSFDAALLPGDLKQVAEFYSR